MKKPNKNHISKPFRLHSEKPSISFTEFLSSIEKEIKSGKLLPFRYKKPSKNSAFLKLFKNRKHIK